MWPYDYEPRQLGKLSEAELDAAIDRHFADPLSPAGWEAAHYQTASRYPTQPAEAATEIGADQPRGRHVPKREQRNNLARGVAWVVGFPLAALVLVAALSELARYVAPYILP